MADGNFLPLYQCPHVAAPTPSSVATVLIFKPFFFRQSLNVRERYSLACSMSTPRKSSRDNNNRIQFQQRKGGALTCAPQQALRCLQENAFSTPLSGRASNAVSCRKFSVSLWTAAEATRIGFGLVVYEFGISPAAHRVTPVRINRQERKLSAYEGGV